MFSHMQGRSLHHMTGACPPQIGFLLRHNEKGIYRKNRISGHASGNVVSLDNSSATIINNQISYGRAGGLLLRGSSTPIIKQNRIMFNEGVNLAVLDEASPIVEDNFLTASPARGDEPRLDRTGHALNPIAPNALAGETTQAWSSYPRVAASIRETLYATRAWQTSTLADM